MRLYLHWPFCLSRCLYCDFNSRLAKKSLMSSYGLALVGESLAWSRLLEKDGKDVLSLYVGGGTPTTLDAAELVALMNRVTEGFHLRGDAEVTVEVNPATWGVQDLKKAREGGINRFSIGVQSLRDEMLSLLGRPHGADEAMETVRAALSLRDASVSVDLLYALPGVDAGGLWETLERVAGLRPHHISLYALTISDRSRMHRVLRERSMRLPDDDDAADQYLRAVSMLNEAGYLRYEISNFCLPGSACLHNLAYWNREDYLGLGAGAHSLMGRTRFWNHRSVLAYIKDVRGGRPAIAGREELSDEGILEEEIILGLRTSSGIPEPLIAGRESVLERMEERGLVERSRGRIRLTSEGMLLSNPLMVELLCA